MLKTLEEPADFVHLILLTDRLGEVLPTIASRCQLVRFDPLPAEEIAARLPVDASPTTASACARLALGDGGARGALALGDGPSLRAEAEALASAALAGDLAGRPWVALLERAGAAGRRWRGPRSTRPSTPSASSIAKRDRRRSETEHAERARRVQRRASTRGARPRAAAGRPVVPRPRRRGLGRAEDVVYAVDRLPRCAPRPRAATRAPSAGGRAGGGDARAAAGQRQRGARRRGAHLPARGRGGPGGGGVQAFGRRGRAGLRGDARRSFGRHRDRRRADRHRPREPVARRVQRGRRSAGLARLHQPAV